MILRFFLLWLPMPFIAILNAGIREKVFTIFFNEQRSHQLSTLTGMILMSIYAWFIFTLLKIQSTRDTWIVGITWLILTLLFEFFIGHYVFKNSWKRLFFDYNLLKGRVWIIFLLYLTALPYLVYVIKN